MDTSSLTTPRFWYGRRSRRDLLRLAAIGLGAAGTAGALLPLTQTLASASGTFSAVPLAHAAQSGYAWVGNHGLDGDTYQREFESLGGQGYRLIKLSGYTVNGQDYYASIWDMSPGPAWVGMHRVPGADYQANSMPHRARIPPGRHQRLREEWRGPLRRHLRAVDIGGWSASTGCPGPTTGMFDQNVAAGLRPLRVSGFTAGGADYIASIWIGDDGTPWAASHGLDAAGYQAEFDGGRAKVCGSWISAGTNSTVSHRTPPCSIGSTKAVLDLPSQPECRCLSGGIHENGASGYTLTHVAGYRCRAAKRDTPPFGRRIRSHRRHGRRSRGG